MQGSYPLFTRCIGLGLAWAVCTGLQAQGTPQNGAPAAAPAQATAAQAAPAPLVVRIGHAGPLSGPIAALGRDEENGVRLAIEDLNARGLEMGGRKLLWQLQAGDDQGDPLQAVALAQRFCAQKVAAVVGHLQSGTSLPAAQIYHQCGLPHITPMASNPALTAAGFTTSFRVIADDSAMTDALLAHAMEQLGVRKLAIIDDRKAYGQGMVSLWEAAAKAQALEVEMLDKQALEPSGKGFKQLLGAVQQSGADALFFAGSDEEAVPLLTEMAAMGMDGVHVLGGDALCTARLPSLVARAKMLEQLVCVSAGQALTALPEAVAWRQRYERRFPGQYQGFSPYAYDATRVLAHAMLRADSLQAEAYLPYLRETRYAGITAHIAFTPQGDLRKPAVHFYAYERGQRKLLPSAAAPAPAAPRPAAG